MFFLLRLVFWITLVCLLLPGSSENNRRLITSVEQTFNDVRGFCQRNPQVCEDVRVITASVLARLKSSADLLQIWVAEQGREAEEQAKSLPNGTASQVARKSSRDDPPPQPITKWQDSLSSADRQMPWRGPGL